MRGASPHFAEALLARVFGLPTKQTMLAALRLPELKDIMRQLDAQGSVGLFWGSWSSDEIREYLSAKFRADDVARLLGIDLRAPQRRPKPKLKAKPLIRDASIVVEAATAAPMAIAPELPAVIEKLPDLHAHLHAHLHNDLSALNDLGENEQRFQHHIVTILERRVSSDSFRIQEKWQLPGTNQFPDVVIRHANGNAAIEIKADGQIDKLLADAVKLRGYLQARKADVTLGILVYRSPRPIPEELTRAMSHQRLRLVRASHQRR